MSVAGRIGMVLLLAGFGVPAAAQDGVGRALDATVEANRAAKASQQRIDQLDDQTRALLERYRARSWQAQQLGVYADQLDQLVAAQDAEQASLNRQIEDMDRTERELLPLMRRMVDSLERFIALDLPFLATERKERLDALKRLLDDPEASNADKFKRILEAWQIEAGYGRSLGAEPGEVNGRQVDVLRVGRTALYYLSGDGSEAGVWDARQKTWVALDRRYRSEVRHGLRIAREIAAPDLLRLPVPAAQAASASGDAP